MHRSAAVLFLSLAALFLLLGSSALADLDLTFGGTGKVTTPIGASNDVARSVALQPGGKVVAAGASFNGSNYDFAVVRYNSNGTLDATFGGTGKVTTPIGASSDEAYSVALQADGKIIAAGYSVNGNADFAVVRYNSDGTLDATFGGTGKVTTPIGASTDYAYSVALQADGKIVAAGFSFNGSKHDFAVVRYNSDGALDATFGGTGKVTTPVGASTDVALSVALQADGKVVAAGYSNDGGSNNDFAVVRYNSDGTLDTTFGGTGKVTTPIGASVDYAYSVAVQADGKIVAAGASFNGSNYDFAVVRYKPDGTLDPTFGGTGKVTTPIGTSSDEAYSMALQADGKIVAAGSSYNGSNYDFAVVRYNPDGTRDATFGGTGKIITPNGASTDYALSVALRAGKIVAAGVSFNGIDNDFAVVRYDGISNPHKNDLAIDFGSSGLWEFKNETTWKQINGNTVGAFATGDIDGVGKDDVIVNFAGTGVWAYENDTSWVALNGAQAESITTGDLDGTGKDDVVIDFGANGIWVYKNDATWQQIHGLSADSIVVCDIDGSGKDDVVADFGPAYGIWTYRNDGVAGWQQLHDVSADSMTCGDLDGSGKDDVVISFGQGNGIWVYRNDLSWQQIHGATPLLMKVADIDGEGKGDIIANFGPGFGIWAYKNNSSWVQIHGLSPVTMSVGDYDGSGQDDLAIDFGPANGVWVYKNNSAWVQRHGSTTSGMESGNIDGL